MLLISSLFSFEQMNGRENSWIDSTWKKNRLRLACPQRRRRSSSPLASATLTPTFATFTRVVSYLLEPRASVRQSQGLSLCLSLSLCRRVSAPVTLRWQRGAAVTVDWLHRASLSSTADSGYSSRQRAVQSCRRASRRWWIATMRRTAARHGHKQCWSGKLLQIVDSAHRSGPDDLHCSTRNDISRYVINVAYIAVRLMQNTHSITYCSGSICSLKVVIISDWPLDRLLGDR